MKKKFIIIILILAVFVSFAIFYINKFVLPIKIKSLIINILEQETQMKATLESLRFNIFKGLVIKKLALSDGQKVIISVKEGSCLFLIMPIFRKKIIIPSIRLDSPVIFLQRRSNQSINLLDFPIFKAGRAQGNKFGVSVYRLNIKNARIDFQDDSLPTSFAKSLTNINLIVSFSLPASVMFSLKSEVLSNPDIKINASGEFRIGEKKMTAKIAIKNLSPAEFAAYYQDSGVYVSEGLMDILAKIIFKNGTLYADLNTQNKNMLLFKNKITARFTSEVEAQLRCVLQDKKIRYLGRARIAKMDILGLRPIDQLTNISGTLRFGSSGLSARNLNADILGLPVKSRFRLSNFSNPSIQIDLMSTAELKSFQKILSDKFQFSLPADFQGKANLILGLELDPVLGQLKRISGYLDLLRARVKANKLSVPFEEVTGRIYYNQNQLKCSGLNFKYLDKIYKMDGILTNFQTPAVQLKLASNELSLESNFAVNGHTINISDLSGTYLNSNFLLKGNIDILDTARMRVDVAGGCNLDLRDSPELLKKFKKELTKIQPEGIVNVEAILEGDINDLKACTVKAEVSSPSLSLYGLKGEGLFINYNQGGGLIDIPLARLSLYDGTMEASARMNLNTENFPYAINLDIKDVKIEKLKLDTEARAKDIAGIVHAQAKINGFSGDLSKLSGAGRIAITEGNLWQLSLFKGLGSLVFDKDYFTKITFREGACGFAIKDKYIFTDSLNLKSEIADLTGPVKIGFDGSIEASLNVEIIDEMVPLSGTFRDVTTAIIGGAGRFGIIKISGTLKEPEYKFKTAVVDILKGIKNTFLGNGK